MKRTAGAVAAAAVCLALIAAVRGTPYEAGDSAGITVSSDYGRRKAKKRARPRARKPKARA